jgi:hypothetical protein
MIIESHPVKTAMLGIRIDLENDARVPALSIPELFIEVDLHNVADLKRLCHQRLRANQVNAPPISIAIPPLIAHCGLFDIKLPGNMPTPCKNQINPASASNIPTILNTTFMISP